jgi:DME family drug/metabolite transporter
VGAWRGLIATLIVGGLVARGGLTGRAALAGIDRAGWLRLVVLGTLGGPVFVVAMNVAVGASGATIAAFVAGLYAVLAALFGPAILGERLGMSAVAAFVIALCGTALLAGLGTGPATTTGLGDGIGAGLVAATSFALYLVLSRRWARSLRPPGAVVALAVFAATAIVLAPATLLVAGDGLLPAPSDPDLAVAVLAVAWLAIGPSVAAQLLLMAGVRRLPARRSSAFLLLNPVTAAILAALFLGERLSSTRVAGAALVLTGMAVASGLPGLIRSAGGARPRRPSPAGDEDQGPTAGSAATR